MGTCVTSQTLSVCTGVYMVPPSTVTCNTTSITFYKPVTPAPTDTSTCTMVISSGAEWASMQASPWNLTESQGATVGAAILGVWAIGWAFRSLIRHLQSTDLEGQS